MRSFLILAFAVITLLSFRQLGATTWYIKDDGTGDAVSIAAGITAATAGDTILLAAGTFTEYDLQITDKPLVILSESGPDVTSVDCQSSGWGIRYYNNLMSTGYFEISGITIANAQGWGIYAVSEQDIMLIENNTITNAIFGIVTGNLASGQVTVNNNRVSGCSNNAIDPGGVAYIEVTNNEITSNGGNGISSTATDFLIDGNVITGNSINGVDMAAASASGTISNNVISDHHNFYTGIFISGGDASFSIANNVIFDNDLGISMVLSGDTIDVVNNTIDQNGYGIYDLSSAGTSLATVSNNIVSNNSNAFVCVSVPAIVVSCNDIYGNISNTICGTDVHI
ncbi:MAG: right-handed parallel beta-helix repeat-containing protein, partial [Saprospiraceae bacterium]|nr:right-handed parallel beta-helix repeat-containing protein [Saprospiraceae bacterium]